MLVALVFVEAAELLAATVASVIAIGTASDAERGSTIALAVTVFVLFLGVVALAWGLLVGRKHLLGGVLTWQFMTIAVAIGAFEGLIVGPSFWWLGLVLLVPALGGIALCIVKPVTGAFGRVPRDAPPQPPAAAARDGRGKQGPTPRRRR